MVRIAVLSALSLVLSTASLAHAQTDIPDDVQKAAADAGVDSTDLLGATLSTGYDPRTYECLADGLLCPPAPAGAVSSCGWPICGALGARLYCIEGHESGHDGRAVNRSSGAAGYLQWLPSTARTWGVIVGNRASEWAAAARIASLGERTFRSQWPVTSGWC